MSKRRHSGSSSGGGRHKARELAVQALYQSDLSGEDIHLAVTQLSEHADSAKLDLDFFQRLALGVHGRLAELDGLIDGAAENWKSDRISVVERNILRLGVFELLAEPETPVKVVINESIELSKRFGGTGSGRFVNGVMDRLAGRIRAQG